MFYSEYVLAKRGPLGKIWLAAHWGTKLSKAQIAKSDVVEACQAIMEPEVKLALRTSGHLLLGVVRIHDKKQRSLMNDCSEAFTRITLVFRTGTVDLPANSIQAPHNAITLQDFVSDFTEDIPDVTDQFLELEAPEALPFEPLMEEMSFDPYSHQRFKGNEDLRHELDIDGQRLDADVSASTVWPEVNADGSVEIGRHDDDIDVDIRPPSPLNPDISIMDESDLHLSPQRSELPSTPKLELLPVITPSKNVRGERPTKRPKLISDDILSISTRAMKKALSEQGPDDISRRPYTKSFMDSIIDYSKPPIQLTSTHFSALETDSVDAMFKPNSYGKHWGQPVRDILVRRLKRRKVEQIEQGRLELSRDQEYGDDVQPIEPDVGPIFDDGPDMSLNITDPSIMEDNQPQEPETSIISTLPTQSDEADESVVLTSEEFAQAGWSKRTKKMLTSLRRSFETSDSLSFDTMTHNQTRSVAAAALFEVLVLKTKGYINIKQPKPFGDITLTPVPEA